MSFILNGILDCVLALFRPEPARALIPVRVDRRTDPRRRR
jgi:hypothetical protein